ncbi:sugar transferase [Terriglobus albidus]|uniref:Sugar transferase n=1 Tax=Terriglobus albidus TaxID=1592106 RepID=A0A5B9EAZ1_9BACT|nr:sugar transferase [Terriglobus albidus]QEE28844.1 sugar transferase [Terriglobus albidus]
MATTPGMISDGHVSLGRDTSRVVSGFGMTESRAAARLYSNSAVAWFDLLLLAFSLAAATLVNYRTTIETSHLKAFLGLRISLRNLLLFLICLAAWRLLLWAAGLYRAVSFRRLASRILLAGILCTPVAIYALIERSTGGDIVRPSALFFLLATGSIYATRGLLAISAGYVHSYTRTPRTALVIGSGPLARKLLQDLPHHPQWDYRVIGFVDSKPQPDSEKRIHAPYLGKVSALHDVLMRLPVEEVFIALPLKSHYEEIQRVIDLCEAAGVQSQYLTNIFTTSITKKLRRDQDRVVMQMVHHDSRRFLKRAFDVVASLLGIIVLSPFFLLVAIAIKLTSKGPVIFKQTRYGLNKNPFSMYKFRSMVVDAESQQSKLEHLNETSGPVFKIKRDPRITRLGALLRKTSIDELPQLFNVLLGDMSLVGPRPLPTRDVSRFSDLSLMRRFSVKPGVTGLWQVSGRSNLDFDGWIALDLRYIDTWTLMLDLRILAMTIPAVLIGRGAS